MTKRVMETIDKYTRLYLDSLVEKDRYKRAVAIAGIMSADDYIGGTDLMLFTSAVHIALVHLALEMSKDFYTRVCNSDIIIDTEE